VPFFGFAIHVKYLFIHIYIYCYLQPPMAHPYPADDDDVFSEDDVWTPRDSPKQLAIRAGYTGPKNNHGNPDTTGTNESGTMIYPPNEHYVSYSGQWKNGEFDGKGTVRFGSDNNGHTYTGGFNNGEMHGRGVYTFPDGQVLDGEFRDDKIVRGKHICPGYYTFQGNFVDGKMHNGTMISDDGTVFEGTFETPTKRVGIFRYTDGDIFTGKFDLVEGGWKLNGYGEMIVNSMSTKYTYKGHFRNGVRHGRGTINMPGYRYSAEYNNDRETTKSRRTLKKGGSRHDITRSRGK
jgi:hypothetical protein